MTNVAIIEDLTLVPVPVWWQSPWFIALVLLALTVAGIALRRWWTNRPQPVSVAPTVPPGPPPHLEALRRLGELRARHAKVDAYAVGVECSDILRSYIEARFALPIRYQTTREFLGAAQAAPELGADAQAELGGFLKFFDQLKFARASATAEQTLATIDGGEQFVRRCMPPGAPGGSQP
jgi:hypothetical protein